MGICVYWLRRTHPRTDFPVSSGLRTVNGLGSTPTVLGINSLFEHEIQGSSLMFDRNNVYSITIQCVLYILPLYNIYNIIRFCMGLYPPCRVGHADAECVIKAGEFIRFKEFSVDVNTLIKLVQSLHFDLLHVFLTSDCIHTRTEDKQVLCGINPYAYTSMTIQVWMWWYFVNMPLKKTNQQWIQPTNKCFCVSVIVNGLEESRKQGGEGHQNRERERD